MPNIILTEDDLKKMEPELRGQLLDFLSQAFVKKNWPKIPSDTIQDNLLEFQRPNIISIEGACSIFFGLNKNSREFIKILVKDIYRTSDKKGYDKEDMSSLLNLSEASLNGIVGSINRRFIYRFDRDAYDVYGNREETYPVKSSIEKNLLKLIHYAATPGESTYWLSYHKDTYCNFEIAIKLFELNPDFEIYDYKVIIPNKKSKDNIEFFVNNASISSFDERKAHVDFYMDHEGLDLNTENAKLGFRDNRVKYWALSDAGIKTHMCTNHVCNSIQVIKNEIQYKKIGPAIFDYNKMKLNSKTETKVYKNIKFNIEDVKIEKHLKKKS